MEQGWFREGICANLLLSLQNAIRTEFSTPTLRGAIYFPFLRGVFIIWFFIWFFSYRLSGGFATTAVCADIADGYPPYSPLVRGELTYSILSILRKCYKRIAHGLSTNATELREYFCYFDYRISLPSFPEKTFGKSFLRTSFSIILIKTVRGNHAFLEKRVFLRNSFLKKTEVLARKITK